MTSLHPYHRFTIATIPVSPFLPRLRLGQNLVGVDTPSAHPLFRSTGLLTSSRASERTSSISLHRVLSRSLTHLSPPSFHLSTTPSFLLFFLFTPPLDNAYMPLLVRDTEALTSETMDK